MATNTGLQGTYAGLLESRRRLLEVRNNKIAAEWLANIFNRQLYGEYYEQALSHIVAQTEIPYDQLDEYYNWFYGSDAAVTAYIFFNPKIGLDCRFDGEGIPNGSRQVGLFDQDGGYLTGYIPEYLRGEALLYVVQKVLDALGVLEITAEDVVTNKYTAFR